MRLTFRRTVVVATLLMVGYTILRSILVWGTLSDYGINPWIFLILDVVTAPLYVWGIGKMIQGLRSVESIRAVYVGGVAVLVAFFAPYAYLFIAGQAAMPLITKVIIGVVVVVLFGAGPLREVIKRSRNR